jgi:hypothetical protein
VSATRFLVFLAWTVLVLGAVGALLFLFTFGDCAGDLSCEGASKRSPPVILAGGFVIYWTVAIPLFRRWSR